MFEQKTYNYKYAEKLWKKIVGGAKQKDVLAEEKIGDKRLNKFIARYLVERNKLFPRKGKDNGNWRGENAGYYPKHQWNTRNWGHPPSCEHCGVRGKYLARKNGVKYWNIQWANKNGKHKRQRSDWVGLCAKCHYAFDGEAQRLAVLKRTKLK
jgi:hypothetical protein